MLNHSKLPCNYTLDEGEKAFVKKIIEENVPSYYPNNYHEFMQACFQTAQKLPNTILNWSQQVKQNNIGVIKNLPLDEPIPNTPIERYMLDDIAMLSDSVIGTISALFGHVFTFDGKYTTRHIHNIYPTFGDKNTQLGYSNGELEWHVEDGFHHDRANWIGLLCLRSDINVVTKIARSKDIAEHSVLPNILFEPYFNLRFDDSFDESMQSTVVKTKVFNNVSNEYEIIFDPYYTDCESEEATEALALVKSIAEEVHQKVILEKGDAVFFDNIKTIHARTSFTPKMDGSDRWLKRVLVIEESCLKKKLINGTIK
jgi:L-asparagine oxygenase